MNRNKRQNSVVFRDFSTEKSRDIMELKALFEKVQKKYGLKPKNLVCELEKDIEIPTSIFNEKLGPLETICKFLKENLNLSNKKISIYVGRDSKSVWQAYMTASKKLKEKFEIKYGGISFPVSILQKRKLSVLENIMVHLKEELGLSYKEISVVLRRDQRTVWTVYQRAKKKEKNDRPR